MANELLRVENLKKYFKVGGKAMLHAVDGVSFTVDEGETLGLVGESGCGKSTIGNVVMQLLTADDGKILLLGENILAMKGREKKNLYRKMQMIFQDPYSSLNPRKDIKSILSEPFLVQKLCRGSEMDRRIQEVCEITGIAVSELQKFPYELDGGKRQMVGIARALSLNPSFIVCDEPVSALDVSVQAKIINLMMELQRQFGFAYLFISHDLSVVRHISNRIAVMYLGKIVELSECDMLFAQPRHPYTEALLSAIPKVDLDQSMQRIVLKGDVPSPINPKAGCRFAGRCYQSREICSGQEPAFREITPGHYVACHFPREENPATFRQSANEV